MLDERLLMAGLYAKPEIRRRMGYYRRKEGRLLSFAQQSVSTWKTDETAEKVWLCRRRAEDLGALENAVIAAVGAQNAMEKIFVELTFYCKYPRERVMKLMELDEKEYRTLKRRTVKKLSRRLDMLGFDTPRFLEKFDDEPLLVRNMERAIKGEG